MVSTTHVPVYTKADLMGKIDPALHPDFVPVATSLTTQNTYMRKEAYEAFEKMAKAAARDGVNLIIVSGTRNYQRQIEIWSDKWTRMNGNEIERTEKILEYSSMPGTSRHHWGTDIDLNSLEPAHFEYGTGKRTYEWLLANAVNYGFFQPYQHGDASCGCSYREEKWHWSYYPISNQILRAYKRMVNYSDLKDFPGAELAPQVKVLELFVKGIPETKPIVQKQINGES